MSKRKSKEEVSIKVIKSIQSEYIGSSVLCGVLTVIFLMLSIVGNSVGLFASSLFLALLTWWGIHRAVQLGKVLYE